MNTPPVSIFLFAVAALLGAVGQWLYQSGAAAATGGAASYAFNWKLWAGVVCYVAVMALFVAAFKIGGSLTTLYPVYASTFIWAALIAWKVNAVPIRPVNIAGMVALVVGMHLLGRQG